MRARCAGRLEELAAELEDRAAGSQQRRPFVEAAGDVEVLQRLAGGALHEIVETRDDHEPRRVAASRRQPMSQKFVHATCLISGSASPVSRTNGSSP